MHCCRNKVGRFASFDFARSNDAQFDLVLRWLDGFLSFKFGSFVKVKMNDRVVDVVHTHFFRCADRQRYSKKLSLDSTMLCCIL